MTEVRSGLRIVGFADQREFEDWLAGQPPDAAGLWIKFAKKGTGKASLSKAEAIDAALCHGWIDGQLKKYDDAYWLVRFTPRKPRSKWSEVNRTRALQLIRTGQIVKTRRTLTPPSGTINNLNLQYFPGLGRGRDRRRSCPPDPACFRPEISTMITVQHGVTVRRVLTLGHEPCV